MIKSIKIENYKSVLDLELNLGRFNVFIGENGCGKSNILEAIAIAGAASQDKMDYEYLFNRGIRTSNPELMFSAFPSEEKREEVVLKIIDEYDSFTSYVISYDNSSKTPNWEITPFNKKSTKTIRKQLGEEGNKKYTELVKTFNLLISDKNVKKINELLPEYTNIQSILNENELSYFLLYFPEYSTLKTQTESPIQPLGVKGEGLLRLIESFKKEELKGETKPLSKLIELLMVFDWFDNLDIAVSDFGHRNLNVTDRYLKEGLNAISEHSSNEGFLFALFYFSLFISKQTPNFFAIDNIDTSLNPKLCREITKELAALAKENDKQVILTTHNPSILDGLNLNDDEQRLFVVSRNKLGHTKIKRVEKKNLQNGQASVKLSEAFTRGYIGGLPKTF